ALREYLTETARQGGFVATLRDDLEREPPAEARGIAYRICQEALTNVRVHASARWVEVRLEEAQGGLQVTVTDDGAGFEADQDKATRRREHLRLSSDAAVATSAGPACPSGPPWPTAGAVSTATPARAPPSGSGSRPRPPASGGPGPGPLSGCRRRGRSWGG